MVMFEGMSKNFYGLQVSFFKIKKSQVKNCPRFLYFTLLFGSNKIKEKHETIKLQNEEFMPTNT